MNVEFRSRRLERAFAQRNEAQRLWGAVVGRRYVERVKLLVQSDRTADLYHVRALDFHPLSGDRAGRHALRLNGQWRLIVTVGEDERTVTIEEVTDYHG